MKTVALVDSLWNGHHPTYFKFFTKTLLDLGYQVMAFCPEPSELYEWIASNQLKNAERLHIFEIQEPEPSRFPIHRFRNTLNTLQRWQNAADVIQYASAKTGILPDLVFFSWLDSYLGHYLTHHVVDKIFPYNWSGLYFQPYNLRLKQKFSSIRFGILNPQEVLKSPRCINVAVLDEGITEKLKIKIKQKPVITFPDFTDQSSPDFNFSAVKQIQKNAKGRKIVGLLGSQGRRKGFLTLLELAQKTVKEDYFYVFAGELAEHTFSSEELTRIQRFIKSEPNNCFFYFKRIPDEPQFNAVVNVIDILFVVYENFPYSSNILTKAAVFEKYVLASNTFCIGERVQNFNLGLSVPEGNVSECIKALYYLCHSDSNAEGLKPNFENYRRIHSLEQIYVAFSSLLEALNI